MKYAYFKERNDLNALYTELRINIIRVNNIFCSKIYEGNEKYDLDVFTMFNAPTVDLAAIIDLTLILEGTAEAMQDEPEEKQLKALKRISRRLKIEMAKLP